MTPPVIEPLSSLSAGLVALAAPVRGTSRHPQKRGDPSLHPVRFELCASTAQRPPRTRIGYVETNISRRGPLGHSSELIRGAVDLVVLSVLRRKPLSAAAVHLQIEALSAYRLLPADHIVYHALERMRGWGWVTASHRSIDAECRYRITRIGRRNLAHAQKAWIRLATVTTTLIGASLDTVGLQPPQPNQQSAEPRRASKSA